VRSRIRLPLTALGLMLALTACVGAPGPVDEVPIGPEPAPTGPLTVKRVAGIVTADDVPATASLLIGTTQSTSGDDMVAERDYWIAVGGQPAECQDVVSAPYLVSSSDAASRDLLDDPSALLATVTELDEERFGLIQVYAREFDDETAARAFLAGFQTTVAGCRAYQFLDDGAVTYDAIALAVEPVAEAGGEEGTVSALVYRETLGDSPDHRTTVYFLQRDGLVLSVYGEVLPSSTITDADIESLAGTIAIRLATL
jgi:hypothetical protein